MTTLPEPELKQFVFKNETPWRTSDLRNIFLEARRFFVEGLNVDPKYRYVEPVDLRQTPDAVRFVTAGADEAYTCSTSTWQEWEYDQAEKTRFSVTKSQLTVKIPANKIDATDLLTVLDATYGDREEPTLRVIVQRLRRIIGHHTQVEFIIQHRNRKKRVHRGRRVRAEF